MASGFFQYLRRLCPSLACVTRMTMPPTTQIMTASTMLVSLLLVPANRGVANELTIARLAGRLLSAPVPVRSEGAEAWHHIDQVVFSERSGHDGFVITPDETHGNRATLAGPLTVTIGTDQPAISLDSLQLERLARGGTAWRIAVPEVKRLRREARRVHGTPDRPHVVVVLCDDLRWNAMSCAGHPHLVTPNIDQLAKEGIFFDNMFCTTSLCSPSRASILSGLYAHSHGITNNFTDYPADLASFPAPATGCRLPDGIHRQMAYGRIK